MNLIVCYRLLSNEKVHISVDGSLASLCGRCFSFDYELATDSYDSNDKVREFDISEIGKYDVCKTCLKSKTLK